MRAEGRDAPRVEYAIDPLLMERHGPFVLDLAATAVGESACPGKRSPGERSATLRTSRAGELIVRSVSERAASVSGQLATGRPGRASPGIRCEQDDARHPLYGGRTRLFRTLPLEGGRLVCERDLVLDVFWLATGGRRWPKSRFGHFDREGPASTGCSGLAPCGCLVDRRRWRPRRSSSGPAPIPRRPGRQAGGCGGTTWTTRRSCDGSSRLGCRRQGTHGLSATSGRALGVGGTLDFDSWVGMERGLGVRSAFYCVPRRGSLLGYAAGPTRSTT